jgi:hypothetical protein
VSERRTFTVVLEVRRGGAAVGSTSDTFEAVDAAEAERLAVDAWKRAEPAMTFRPLLTRQHT